MQTFKEISYQNYIELRFNQKNLNELSENEALLKYKRNAQLLAQIFSFEKKQRKDFVAQPIISKQHIETLQRQILRQQQQGNKKCEELELKTKKYCNFMNQAKNIKSQQEKYELIEKLKQADLYDNRHPYFADGSPFFMNKTQEQFLQVLTPVDSIKQENFQIIELNNIFKNQKNENK